MKVICRYCREKEEKPLMQKEKYGYYHPKCYAVIEEDEKEKELDFILWCDLYELIKEIHDTPHLPSRFTGELKDIRNGTIRQGKYVEEQNRKGLPYELLIEGYERSRDAITRIINTMTFDSEYGQIKYCFGVVKKEVNKIYLERKKADAAREETERFIEQAEKHPTFKFDYNNYQKQESDDEEIDLTDLF